VQELTIGVLNEQELLPPPKKINSKKDISQFNPNLA
jgi:hypothetical protein